MKSMLVLWSAFVLVVGLVLPVRAQSDTATVTFEITAANVACPNTTYWAVFGLPASEFVAQQLTDGDGNGVFTGSVEATAGGQLTISLVQGTGVGDSVFGPIPGSPSTTIKDFGFVTIEEDTTFAAQTTGCAANLPPTGRNTNVQALLLASSALLLAVGAYVRRRIGLRA